MTRARDKIKTIANDKLSPYKGNYISESSEMSITNSRYDTKYLLLFLYLFIAFIIILSSSR